LNLEDKGIRATLQKLPGFLVIVSFTVGLSSGENWLLRAAAGFLLLASILIGLIPLIVSRRFVCLGPRLVNSSLKVRLTVEVIGRLGFLALTVFVLPIFFKTCSDLGSVVALRHPVKIDAIATYVPSGSLWGWGWKEIGLQTADGSDEHYNLFFHPHNPKQGQRYEVAILPKSKCVLSLQPKEAE
jgi:hypothetical protein